MSKESTSPLPDQEKALGQYLSVQKVKLCPEIRLWLVAGHVDMNARCQELLDGGYAPYWAFCWGAGQALARFILDNPSEVYQKRVVDFGAGSGIAAIAAALMKAKHVTAVDIDPKALQFVKLNAQLNQVQIEIQAKIPNEWDILLVSDVLYEITDHHWLMNYARQGREVLISDPQRPGNPILDIKPVVRMSVTTQPNVDYPICQASVYRLSNIV